MKTNSTVPTIDLTARNQNMMTNPHPSNNINITRYPNSSVSGNQTHIPQSNYPSVPNVQTQPMNSSAKPLMSAQYAPTPQIPTIANSVPSSKAVYQSNTYNGNMQYGNMQQQQVVPNSAPQNQYGQYQHMVQNPYQAGAGAGGHHNMPSTGQQYPNMQPQMMYSNNPSMVTNQSLNSNHVPIPSNYTNQYYAQSAAPGPNSNMSYTVNGGNQQSNVVYSTAPNQSNMYNPQTNQPPPNAQNTNPGYFPKYSVPMHYNQSNAGNPSMHTQQPIHPTIPTVSKSYNTGPPPTQYHPAMNNMHGNTLSSGMNGNPGTAHNQDHKRN